MKKILMLTDYKGNFGSLSNSKIYRAGMNINLLKKYFKNNGYDIIVKNFSDISFRENDFVDLPIIYPSSEDIERKYKKYIEDIVYALELKGLDVIPKYKYLKAHDNKVFMEILRDLSPLLELKTIHTNHFGTLEEFKKKEEDLQEEKYVIKASEGAQSKGVVLSESNEDLINKVKLVSRSKKFKFDLIDKIRALKHKGYVRESLYRNKFIIQDFIPNLKNDWRVLIMGDRYYIFYRSVKGDDFRASGSGIFEFNDVSNIPQGIFDFSKRVFDSFNVPQISMDIVYDGNEFHVIEFQFLYYGTYAHNKSKFCFKNINNQWTMVNEELDFEKVYADSIVKFIEKI